MDHDSKTNEIRVKKLRGLNERQSPDNNDESDFDICRGLYPSRVGLLSRLPGSTLLSIIGEGEESVLGFCQTFFNDGILIQSSESLYRATLAELQGREADATDFIFTARNEEETMSMAILLQSESNNTNGGSAKGQQTGTETTSAADTWYGRRITAMPVNESSTVASVSYSTGGGSGFSTEGTFTLAPGSYRITVTATYNLIGQSSGGVGAAMFGLYNVTDGAFQKMSDNATYFLSTVVSSSNSGEKDNTVSILDGPFTVSSSNKTFAIRHKGGGNSVVRDIRFCGRRSDLTSTTSGAITGTTATNEVYMIIKILKTA